jgi:hypothetical protein
MLTVLDKSLRNRTLHGLAKFIFGFATVRIVGPSSTLVVAHGLNTVKALSARRQSVARG